ncbi:hypothetical protein F4677DRAFT_442092 [Hypoxylon crocopeplum]|nr:hypothetical protein F4677DRAFT_442092 [Hypoxylon crocopeplum]
MAHLEKLVPELSVMIIKFLPAADVISAIHASPNLRSAFVNGSQMYCYNTVVKEVDKQHLATAVALYHAECADWTIYAFLFEWDEPAPQFSNTAMDFCQTHMTNLRPEAIAKKDIDMQMMLRILSFHRAAKYAACEFSGMDIWTAQYYRTKFNRYIKVAYIFELARRLVPYNIYRDWDWPTPNWTSWRVFWRSFAPWEFAGIQQFETWIQFEVKYKDLRTKNKIRARLGEQQSRREVEEKHLPKNRIAVHWGLRNLYADRDTQTLPEDFYKDAVDMWAQCPELEPRKDFFRDIKRDDEDLSGKRHNTRRALELAKQFPDEEETGPRDIWLWSYVAPELKSDSPLYDLAQRWIEEFFSFYQELSPYEAYNDTSSDFYDSDHSEVDGMFEFGQPSMGRYCFLDRHVIMKSERFPDIEGSLEYPETKLLWDEAEKLSAKSK